MRNQKISNTRSHRDWMAYMMNCSDVCNRYSCTVSLNVINGHWQFSHIACYSRAAFIVTISEEEMLKCVVIIDE
jgi:hypothetical protein